MSEQPFTNGAPPNAHLPPTFRDTNPICHQDEYGYLFGFIPIHVNSALLDIYDFFEFPAWYDDYITYNKFQDDNIDIVKASVSYVEKNHIPPPEPALGFYGGHLKAPFDHQRGIRRGYELYEDDMNLQRYEVKHYGVVKTRQSTDRPTRFYDGTLSAPPGVETLSIHTPSPSQRQLTTPSDTPISSSNVCLNTPSLLDDSAIVQTPDNYGPEVANTTLVSTDTAAHCAETMPEVVTDFTFKSFHVTPPFVTHYFYETIQPLLPRLLIETIVSFSLVYNAHLAWISPVGGWNAIVSALLILSALHVSSSMVNSGILALVIGLAGFQPVHIPYFFCHGLGQVLGHLTAYYTVAGYVSSTDINPDAVIANLGVPSVLTMGKMIYHPLIMAFFESITLAVIAINFTGKRHMKDAAVSSMYFVCTACWSYIINVFRPKFPICFDFWWGIWNPLMTYLTTDDIIDWETMLYSWAVFPIAVLAGAYIAGILCRLSLHLEARRYERYGHFTAWGLLSQIPPSIRRLYYEKLKNRQFDEIIQSIDDLFNQGAKPSQFRLELEKHNTKSD